MHNLEVWNMVLSKERELERSRCLEESRIRQALDEPRDRATRPDRGGALRRAWHVASGVLSRRWRWAEPRRDEREPRITAADELVLEIPGGR